VVDTLLVFHEKQGSIVPQPLFDSSINPEVVLLVNC
jgi:hypothetical protein